MKDIYEIPYKTKYGHLFTQYLELVDIWTNPDTHKFIEVDSIRKDTGRPQRHHYVKIGCAYCGELVEGSYGKGWVVWGSVAEAYVKRGCYLCYYCTGPSRLKSRAETLGEEGLRNSGIKSSKVLLESNPDYYKQLGSWTDGRSEALKKRAETMGPEGLKESSRKAMETMGPEGLSERGKKIYESERLNGTGICSEKARKNLVDSINRLREERGYSWATQSTWEQEIAEEFGGTCGLSFYSYIHKNTIYPDIVFPDGHVIQIDDKKHKAVKGLTKNNWNTGEKKPTYEKEYDEACLQEYGKRPLHLMLPHIGASRRERFDTWREVVVAYLEDRLEDDEFILTSDYWYGDIEY